MPARYAATGNPSAASNRRSPRWFFACRSRRPPDGSPTRNRALAVERRDVEGQIRAIESGAHALGIAQHEAGDDLLGDLRRRRRRARHHGRVAKLGDDCGQAETVREEVVAPLADVVRLVDDEERELTATHGGAEGARREALGRGEADGRPAVADGLERRPVRLAVAARREHDGRVAERRGLRDWSRMSAMSGETTTVRSSPAVRGADSRGSCRRPSASPRGRRDRRARPARPRAGRARTPPSRRAPRPPRGWQRRARDAEAATPRPAGTQSLLRNPPPAVGLGESTESVEDPRVVASSSSSALGSIAARWAR
jgi:hypothetical protein